MDRSRHALRALVLALAVSASAACGGGSSAGAPAAEGEGADTRVLVFSRTEGFRHRSIDNGLRLMTDPSRIGVLDVTLTEDAAAFTDANLSGFDVVMFLNTTGDVLDLDQQEAFVRYVRSGGGYVGVHSAADTEHDWPWYGELVGAYFTDHPPIPFTLEVTVEDGTHPSTEPLPPVFEWQDEWYNFDRNPRQDSAVLMTIPPVLGLVDGPDHPIAWYKEFEGGRSWYTNLGHRPESWENPLFVEHLKGGIRWAASHNTFNRVVLSSAPENPVALDVAPDGRVFYAELSGDVMVWDPSTGVTRRALHLDVDTNSENGLLGLVLDPAFARNGRLYAYHSARVGASEVEVRHEEGDGDDFPTAAHNILSRFEVGPDATIDPATRVDLLHVPSERQCCHEGGGLDFAPDGTLLLSVGDNTNPFDNGGTAPLDNREGRDRWDARRTSANPFDLRGKILRIRPDGSIPPGNLFPADGSEGRPEIYVMGTRNPFRIAVDQRTGRLWWGDVGPDATFDSSLGPRGYDEINFADGPGNYGWPYCIAWNVPYVERDYETGALGDPFDCSGNQPALLAYDYTSRWYLALGGLTSERAQFTGRTATAGTFYRAPRDAPFRLPDAFADRLLMTEWTRDVIAAVDLDENDQLVGLRRLAPFVKLVAPIDLDVGPDGALYVLEYGSGLASNNADARLNRLEHSARGRLTPVAAIQAEPLAGTSPLEVRFTSEGSRADGRGDTVVGYEWDVDGDGAIDGTGPEHTHVYATDGVFDASLTVVGSSGLRSFPAVARIVVGNRPPEVAIDSPAAGAVLEEGRPFVARGHVTDVEDGEIDCDDVVWDIRLGHNAHSHPIETARGCEVDLVATFGGHDESGTLFYVVEMRYTDRGGPNGEPPLVGRDAVQVQVRSGEGFGGACTEDDLEGLRACSEQCTGSAGIDAITCFVSACGGAIDDGGPACQVCLVEAAAQFVGQGAGTFDDLVAFLVDGCRIEAP